MSLTILNVAYPLAPVGPDAVGGAEQVLTQLDTALTLAGHNSLVIACEDSITAGTLIPLARPRGSLDESTHAVARQAVRNAVRTALDRWPIDLVHLHGVDFHHYLPPPGVSVLATLHLPPAWYPPAVFRLERPRTFVHCVSATQRRACPPCAYQLPEIENGIAEEFFSPTNVRDRFFALALGRICPEKGFHIAMDAAARAHLPMVLAGRVFKYPYHQQYFRRRIVPRLSPARRFIGPLAGYRKRRTLLAAHCLLAPSLAPETSSLVAMESLACGTPVIAFPAGALAEIIEHGTTGFLVRDVREMADAIPACRELDADDCRHSARQRFGLQKTIKKYFEVYHRLADSASGRTEVLQTNGGLAQYTIGDSQRGGTNYSGQSRSAAN